MLYLKSVSHLIFFTVILTILTACQAEKRAIEIDERLSEESLEFLLDSAPLPSNIYLIATDNGWQFTPIDSSEPQDLIYESNIAPKCDNQATPRVFFPANQDLTLSLATTKSLSKDNFEFPQFCLKDWGIKAELVPGLIQGINISTGQPRTICAVCYDTDGSIIPRTTLLFEIGAVEAQ